jgi:hypothetical protein
VLFHVLEIYIKFNSIKLNIDINNDELLRTIWKHKKKSKTIDCSAKEHGAQIGKKK